MLCNVEVFGLGLETLKSIFVFANKVNDGTIRFVVKFNFKTSNYAAKQEISFELNEDLTDIWIVSDIIMIS